MSEQTGNTGNQNQNTDNQNTGGNENTSTMLPPEYAKLIPEKFGGDLNKFIKSYNDMGREIRSRQETNNQPNEPKAESKSLSFDKAYNQFLETGKWSEDAVKTFGLSDAYIKDAIESREGRINTIKNGLKQISGEEDPNAIIEYVKQNTGEGKKYSTDEVNALNTLLMKGKFNAFQYIADDYKATKAQQSESTANNQNNNGNTQSEYKPGQPANTSGGFKDQNEFHNALKQYNKGSISKADLERRLASTPESIRSKF